MAAKIRRQYAGAAAQTSITSAITAGDTSVSVASTTGWPSTASVPFYVVIDPDTSVEEKCSVTISGSTLTLTRGVDGTVAAAHASGATIYPVFTATDADEANELASKFTAKGDLVAQGSSTFTTVTVGANGTFLKADSGASAGVSWDAIDLGTDTTGNYVATIAGTSNQVTVSGSGSESAAVTLSTPQDIHTGATPTFAGAILSGSSSGDLLRITQTGAGNALLVEDSTNPDSTPFLIDASGRAILGHTASIATGGVNQLLQVHHTVANVFLSRWIANASGSELRMGKSRSATIGSYSAVSASDVLATINGYGDDGTEFILAGNVAVRAEGTISTGVVPGRLEFGTANSSGVNTERMRIDSLGRVTIGGTATAGQNLRVATNATGSTTARQILSTTTVQSDVTSTFYSISSFVSTQAASFTLDNLYHFHAQEGTIGAGSTVTNQTGFVVGTGLIGATNNFGFRGAIASGTGRWNLYMDGTAANYMAGRLGVGATLTSGAMAQVTNTTAADKALVVKGAASQSGNLFEIQNSAGTAQMVVDSGGLVGIGGSSLAARIVYIVGNVTGGTTAYGVLLGAAIQSDVTSTAHSFASSTNTAATAFTLTTLNHFTALGIATPGAGSTITNQQGFFVNANLTGATNNYAFRSTLAAASNRWNLYMDGTARNYLAGGLEVVAGTTGMTTGFTHVPAAAGAPTGAPTNPTGNTPLYYDTTNNKLYVYNGAWKSVSLT